MIPDWLRNFGSCITEKLRIRVEWARTIVDIRLGFKSSDGKWHSQVQFWIPTTQNFWNGIFTFSIYVIKTHLWKIPILIPRFGMVVRFAYNWWFEAGIGYLFDRGEFGAKCVVMNWYSEEEHNPGCNAVGWNEGPV